MLACGEEDMTRRDGHDVEEGQDTGSAEDEVALRVDFLRIGIRRDWGRCFGLVCFANFAERA